MKKPRFLLKFGKKKHIEDLIAGKLYCSNAETFWGIEKDLKIKGQGDILEGGTKMFGEQMIISEHGSDEAYIINGLIKGLVHVEPATCIPVYCMFAVFDEDCIVDENGKWEIALSETTKEVIRNHFPNADTVAIVKNPDAFLEDVTNTIGTRVKHECVGYYNIDNGFSIENSNKIAMDHEYMMYLMQDTEPVIVNGRRKYSFLADYSYRVLFCKDKFFSKEQEYRIVLPDEKINKGTFYTVNIEQEIDVVSLADLF